MNNYLKNKKGVKMTKEEARKKAEIMLAYAGGKQIQFYSCESDKWHNINNPDFAFDYHYYRIKPEFKYRPLKPKELISIKGKWLVHKNGSSHELVTRVDIETGRCYTNGTVRDTIELFRHWTYEDGTPVGVEVINE